MRIVVALGGNALLRRGEPMTMNSQRANARMAAIALAAIRPGNELVITHGNGPQIGLLALQAAAFNQAHHVPLDVLGAESDGMIGYMIEQELRNVLPPDAEIATLLTMVEVDLHSPAFEAPTKFIGPGYDRATRISWRENGAGGFARMARSGAVSCPPRCRFVFCKRRRSVGWPNVAPSSLPPGAAEFRWCAMPAAHCMARRR